MSFKHLRGVENSTLRRRILRAEQDLPEMLRGHRPRRGHTMHAIHGPDPAPQPPIHGARPASEAQTPIGAQLSLPPNHAAASWLSTSWTVPGLADPLPDVLSHSAMPPTLPSSDAARWRDHGIHSATPVPQPPPLHAETTAATTPRTGSKRSLASMDVRHDFKDRQWARSGGGDASQTTDVPSPQTDNAHDALGGDEWLRQGHAFIGKRVRRRILDAEQAGQTAASNVDGTVVGWLPAHMSNYFKDDDPAQPAALWRVQYDDPAIGQEDLEESEVTDAAATYSARVFDEVPSATRVHTSDQTQPSCAGPPPPK
eukprot:Tamp_13320.p1 GENE.Tamp_13320~~Tamp_13320.p1  ORF type:complete len:313 (+),score=34.99 Tamp_13320:298-1236(+)